MSEGENTSTPDGKALNLPSMSAETWKLIEHRLMGKIKKTIWTSLAAVLTIIVAVVTIFGVFGYLGIPSYIQSQFRDKIEEQTKNFSKFRDDIGKQQANIYADEKIFIALLEMYLRDQHTLFNLGAQAIGEINQSETLNATNMLEFKKLLIDGIRNMAKQLLTAEQYKKLRSEISEKHSVNNMYGRQFDAMREIFQIYPHVWALGNTLRRSIDRLVAKESGDDETKSILFKEYEISFYPVYRREFDLFGEDTFVQGNLNWRTLFPLADELFSTLNPYEKAFESWREQRSRP